MKNQMSFSGIVDCRYYYESDAHKKIKLVQKDGYKVDLIGRFAELVECLSPSTKLNISYWVSDTSKPKEEMLEGYLRQLFGAVEVGYSTEHYAYSEWTSGTYEISTLKIGGHNLFEELSSYNGKYVHIEVNFSGKYLK